jgi:hypothetical protein
MKIFISMLLLTILLFSIVLWNSPIVNKVLNTESVTQNYQWFYDQYNAIQAQQANYNSANGSPEQSGMKMVLNNSIAEYNSRSKQIHRNLWKPTDLPYQLEFVK